MADWSMFLLLLPGKFGRQSHRATWMVQPMLRSKVNAVIVDRGFQQQAVERQPGRPTPVHRCTKVVRVCETQKGRYSVVTLASACAFCSRDLYFCTSSRAWLSRTSVALWLLACCFWPRLIDSNSCTDTYTHTYIGTHPERNSRAPRSKKWNFRTQFLENFRTISGHFCQFHEAQDTENARFSVFINVINITTKANRHFYKHI